MIQAKYDTTELKTLIINSGYSLNEFSKRINKATKVNTATVRSHLLGYHAFQNNEIITIGKLLKISDAEATGLCTKKSADNNPQKKPTREAPERLKEFNYEALLNATENAGLTPHKVCNILGISTSSYWNWKNTGKGPGKETLPRLAKLLNVEPSVFYTEPTQNDSVKNGDSANNSADTPARYKNIDTQNIMDIFGVINDNILTFVNDANKAAVENQNKIDVLQKTVNELTQKMDLLLHLVGPANNKEHTALTKPIDAPKTVRVPMTSEFKSLSEAYNRNDSYDVYKNKINRMVGMITAKTQDTHKQTLHKLYKEMTNVYGVVFDQLEKDYIAKYKKKNNGTIELLYENELFRNIFYNLVVSKAGTVLKEEA